MASPLAGSYVTLTKDQKMKGCVLANIGSETASIVVYDEGVPMSVKVFPVGSGSITDDLALGFRISLEDAERIKLGRLGGAMYPRKKVDDMITTRFKHLFDLVDKHLRKDSGSAQRFPQIILSGGGSGQNNITDTAKNILGLPARIAELKTPPESKTKDATWAVAYGLAYWGLGDTTTSHHKPLPFNISDITDSVKGFLKQFMP